MIRSPISFSFIANISLPQTTASSAPPPSPLGVKSHCRLSCEMRLASTHDVRHRLRRRHRRKKWIYANNQHVLTRIDQSVEQLSAGAHRTGAENATIFGNIEKYVHRAGRMFNLIVTIGGENGHG